MYMANWRKRSLTFLLILAAFIFLSSLAGSSATLAQGNAAFVGRGRALESDQIRLVWLSRPGRMPSTL